MAYPTEESYDGRATRTV